MKPFLDWSAYKDAGMGDAYADIPKHGDNFAKAVAACINSRQCEEAGKQVMCPSFRISGNPNLSTGGRVRLLKAALNNDVLTQALADPELEQAMDLCVACKGCKRECEANVDMPLIKAEYLAQRATQCRPSLRSQLFAHTPRWLHQLPWLKPLIRARNRNRLLQQASAWFGLAPERLLPEPALHPFQGTSDSPKNSQQSPLPEVVLLVDTFNRHFEPHIAEAALSVLRAGGYQVQIAEPSADLPNANRPLCCGRTYLAQGMIKEARHEAWRLAQALLPHVHQGRIIVGLEASCILGLRDDAQALGLGEDIVTLSKNCFLLEEFLAKEIMAKRLNLPLGPLPGGETLIHGHCHQKAVGAMKAMRRVLKLIPDHQFNQIEAGCCGMAGTFGIEKEHIHHSTAMAEQGLMPTLRANPEAGVLANGFSCRHQMRAHGDTRPRHLAEILRDALVSKP